MQHHLSDHLVALQAPAMWLSPAAGDACCGADGLYVADRRLVATWKMALDGNRLLTLDSQTAASHEMRVLSYAPLIDGRTRDPQLTLTRTRTVHPSGAAEHIEVANDSATEVAVVLRIGIGTDLATPGDVRAGNPGHYLPWLIDGRTASASADDAAGVSIAWDAAAQAATHQAYLELVWDLRLAPGQRWQTALEATALPAPPHADLPDFRPASAAKNPWPARPTIASADPRVATLLQRSVADLAALQMSDPDAPEDSYLAAGTPWYFTLFGRDSLWSARLTLALGTELAAGTLRTLSRRQGLVANPHTGEEPGRILHEARPARVAAHWPPLYYGSIDSTALWVCTLVDAWRWGMPSAQVRELLDPLERALTWMIEFGDGGQGFLAYAGNPHALVNQGWKDSAGAIRHADGTSPEGPIALCEVQGYAYEAMAGAAVLLAAFGRDGAKYRDWAEALAVRFRDKFWIGDEHGPFPAIALDGQGWPVTGAASNMAHLIGTGLLTATDEDLVVARLSEEDLSDGRGLRAVSSGVAGFNAQSYHGGAIWVHDTTIAIHALTRTGRPAHAALAARLASGLLTAGERFGQRMPELFGGHRGEPGRPVVPYPAACPVQAWAAASGPLLVTAALGLNVDAPAEVLEARPPSPALLGAFSVDGLRIAGMTVSAEVAGDGSLVRFDTVADPESERPQQIPPDGFGHLAESPVADAREGEKVHGRG